MPHRALANALSIRAVTTPVSGSVAGIESVAAPAASVASRSTAPDGSVTASGAPVTTTGHGTSALPLSSRTLVTTSSSCATVIPVISAEIGSVIGDSTAPKNNKALSGGAQNPQRVDLVTWTIW